MVGREHVQMPDGGAGGRGRGGWPRRVAVVAGHTGCRGPLRAAGRDGRGTAKTKIVEKKHRSLIQPWG